MASMTGALKRSTHATATRKNSEGWTNPVRVALGGLGLAAAGLLWAAAIEPRLLDEVDVDVRVPFLPPAWHGQRLAALGDLQIGVWWANTDTSRRAISRVVEARPAAVLLLGDFLYHPSPDRKKALADVSEILTPLAASDIPVFAVLGNHDYGLDDEQTAPPAELAKEVRRRLGSLGITVLENSAVKLPNPKGDTQQEAAPLYLAGIGVDEAGHSDPTAAISAIPDEQPRIVMMHNPHAFQRLPPGSAPFAVAGHTHGAQVRIPILPGRSWLARHEDEPAHVSGWAAPEFGEQGNRLYVNRGIGFSGLPVRFGARPELTHFRLHPS